MLLIEVNNLTERTIAKLTHLRQEAKGLSIGSNELSSSNSFRLSDEDTNEETASEIGDEEEDIKVKEGK